jgi:hypothetical protein
MSRSIFVLAFVGMIVGRVIDVHSPQAAVAEQAEHAVFVERFMLNLCSEVRKWDAAVPGSSKRGQTNAGTIAWFRRETKWRLENKRVEYQWTKPCPL